MPEDAPADYTLTMSKSQRLRLHDVRAAYRLLGECRELGADAVAWRRHLLTGLCTLLGARFGVSSRAALVQQAPTRVEPEDRLVVVCPDDPRTEEAGRAIIRDPSWHGSTVLAALTVSVAELGTCRREEVVRDGVWYRDFAFTEVCRPWGLDDNIHSFRGLPHRNEFDGMAIFRALGDRRLDVRQRRLVELCHTELAPLVGTALATPDQPNLSGLPPRRRQILERLLEGDSEKQAARFLGLSSQTVHDHVKVLYRHFGVASRGELMALFLRRFRGGLPPAPPGGQGAGS